MLSPELLDIPDAHPTRDTPSPVAGFSKSPGQRCPRIDSHRLLQGTRELLIAHAGEHYRLRLTRNDKLILTK
jgi:hemin uptake protein HemP